MKTTLKDIAKECRVAMGTVSDILNNTGKYKSETRQRIFDTAERLNYRPRKGRSVLEQRKTKVIGLVLPTMKTDSSLIRNAIRYFKEYAGSTGFECMLYEQWDITQKLAGHTHKGTNPFLCDGLIMFCSFGDWDQLLTGIRSWGVSSVLIRRPTTVPGIPVITDNDYKGARMVMDHLYGLGHRRIGLIHHSSPYLDERKRGYTDFLKDQGLPFDEQICFDLYQETGACIEQWVPQMLELPQRPTAFFCFDDHDALILINTLREHNISVPTDIAVVGYDNDPMGEKLHPYLTTVEIPAPEMISLACKTILGFLNGGPVASMKIELENKLIIRESCGAK